MACLLEVLAGFRRDPKLAVEFGDIAEDDENAASYPTVRAGEVSYSWLTPRSAASARLTGRFGAVTVAESIAELRRPFVALAPLLGLHDFDAAALKDARSRTLTQAVATYLHAHTELDGVALASRHGDELALYAVFERAGDPAVSRTLDAIKHQALSPEDPDLREGLQNAWPPVVRYVIQQPRPRQ